MLALPIFPARLQASIFGADELNFRVRNGNGWTLIAINTNLLFLERKSKQKELSLALFCFAFSFKERLCFHTLKTEQNNLRTLRKRLHSYSLEPAFRSSPRLISTGQLHTLLHFHLRPINDIVYVVPYSIKDERSHLRESFTLRCFQRLSRPHLATLLCRWHDNRCTRGASIPVLSY